MILYLSTLLNYLANSNKRCVRHRFTNLFIILMCWIELLIQCKKEIVACICHIHNLKGDNFNIFPLTMNGFTKIYIFLFFNCFNKV